MNKENIQKILLRLTGAIEILAFIAVIMPRRWMQISHSWLGLGVMPRGPVLMFLIRQASYTYGIALHKKCKDTNQSANGAGYSSQGQARSASPLEKITIQYSSPERA